jgi:hypothetical protein
VSFARSPEFLLTGYVAESFLRSVRNLLLLHYAMHFVTYVSPTVDHTVLGGLIRAPCEEVYDNNCISNSLEWVTFGSSKDISLCTSIAQMFSKVGR